jgi:hypothetical protein
MPQALSPRSPARTMFTLSHHFSQFVCTMFTLSHDFSCLFAAAPPRISGKSWYNFAYNRLITIPTLHRALTIDCSPFPPFIERSQSIVHHSHPSSSAHNRLITIPTLHRALTIDCSPFPPFIERSQSIVHHSHPSSSAHNRLITVPPFNEHSDSQSIFTVPPFDERRPRRA